MNKIEEIKEVLDTFRKLRERLDLDEVVDVNTGYIFADEDGMARINKRGIITVKECLGYLEGKELNRVRIGEYRQILGIVGLIREVRKKAIAGRTYLEMERKDDPEYIAERRFNGDVLENAIVAKRFYRFYNILKRYDPRKKTKSF